jgi:hypothetical protein
VPAIQRGIQATQGGRPAVLEMITKEEPIYPTSRGVLEAVRDAVGSTAGRAAY